MASTMAERITSAVSIFLIALVCTSGAGNTTDTKYQVIVLLPLSGPESSRGRVQLAAIQRSVREHMYKLNVHSNRPVSIGYHDSQCDPAKERRIVSEYVVRSESRLAIIGGNCLSSSTLSAGPWDSLAGLRLFVPQITFENAIPVSEEDEVHDPQLLCTRPNSALANGALLQFIKRYKVKELALFYRNDVQYEQAKTHFEYMNSLQRVTNITLSTEWQQGATEMHLRSSHLRVVLLLTNDHHTVDIVCGQSFTGRYTWLVPTLDAGALSAAFAKRCHSANVYMFEVPAKINFKIQDFAKTLKVDTSLADELAFEAALAYDTANVFLGSLNEVKQAKVTQDRMQFTGNVSSLLATADEFGITGRLHFDSFGSRQSIVDIYKLQVSSLVRMGVFDPKKGQVAWSSSGHSEINYRMRTEMRSSGVPMSMLVVFCALTFIGISYAIAMLVFNVVTQKHKIIKMTSPNINVVIMIGAILGYGSLLPLGFDSTRCSLSALSKVMQATTFLVTISFSVIYGCIFAKTWRVYLVFRHLTFNGNLARDEHLLLGVSALVLLDLAVLLPWTFMDPIVCTQRAIVETYEASTHTDVVILMDMCSSRLQGAWIAIIYVIKLVILALGTYVARQTRHVTLRSLSDARPTYVVVGTVVAMATLALPSLLANDASAKVTRAVSGVAIWLSLTVTMLLLFLPKVLLFRKEQSKTSSDDIKFRFTESMQKTQEAEQKNSSRCCRWWCGCSQEDKYAEVVLTTEIESLKSTLKEKETTIRELTDRLYFGKEKFQEYLQTPTKRNRDTDKEPQRTRHNPHASSSSLHTRTHDSLREYRLGRFYKESERSHDGTDALDDGIPAHVPSISRIITTLPADNVITDEMTSYHNHGRSTSPNHDSAIDNTSPSTEHSASSCDHETSVVRRPLRDLDVANGNSYALPIDIIAMESDANAYDMAYRRGSHEPEDTKIVVTEPYWTRVIDGTTVSQI